MKVQIIETPFGTFCDKAVRKYTLTNANGMSVAVINYGGTITNIFVPDKNGETGDVVLGSDSLEGYLQNGTSYFGSLIGRYSNRIANGKFILNDKEYTLAVNDNGNSLHGGKYGYDKVYWDIEKTEDSSLKLTYLSVDGEEGFPGNLDIEVIYSLASDNSLQIEYTATTDKPTPINLTSHCYFNLSAGKEPTILKHQLQLMADQYTKLNDKQVPTGEKTDVRNTAMDFTTLKIIGKDIGGVKGGYDHNWILNTVNKQLHKAADLYEPVSGRYLEMFTTEPGVQFYSGNFLNGKLTGTKNEQNYVQYGGLCLEAQHYPDSPNQPLFPDTILIPGEEYKQTTLYKFSVR